MRLNAPAVIGELMAGIVLGPSLLGWIEPTEVIRLLAEIGIIMLLFAVGIGTDIRLLLQSGRQSIIVALGGLVAPFLFGFFACRELFDFSVIAAAFVGGTLTATSIGITVRVLSGLGHLQAREGQIVLGAAVLDDVLGVMLLAFLYEFSLGQGFSFMDAGKVLVFVSVFFLLAPFAARAISLLVERFDHTSEIPGFIPTTIVSLVLLFAWLAHLVGAPLILGGFAAGLALSRRFFWPVGIALQTGPEFSMRIQSKMGPVVQLFTPIFFVTVGLSLNLREIDWASPFIWNFSLAILVLAVAGKFAGALLLREGWFLRGIVGLAMVPRGEVGLIFAELGRKSGILSNDVYAGMVIVIALTTLLPPFVMKWYYSHLRRAAAVGAAHPPDTS